MNRILLVGAGFSNNWGGWLAREILGDLLARLADDRDLSDLLNSSSNFEDALSEVQLNYKVAPSAATRGQLEKMQAAIHSTFDAMNTAFAARRGMEFTNQREYFIRDYLGRFDAIFTLNQDLLFELHYNIELAEPRRWAGHYFPGMQPPPGWHNAIGTFLRDRLDMVWHPMREFQIDRHGQPIYKLHGSVNWKDNDDGALLVMGANKATTITENRILHWYFDEFKRYLEMPETRLMVIGYGFHDQHINELLYETWRRSQFRMFIVDPAGRAVMNIVTNLGFVIPNPLQKIQIVGESMRRLETTFNGDELEHGRFLRFFT
ncbi:MAG: SIR2 family protein [Burkholderiales bacterium]